MSTVWDAMAAGLETPISGIDSGGVTLFGGNTAILAMPGAEFGLQPLALGGRLGSVGNILKNFFRTNTVWASVSVDTPADGDQTVSRTAATTRIPVQNQMVSEKSASPKNQTAERIAEKGQESCDAIQDHVKQAVNVALSIDHTMKSDVREMGSTWQSVAQNTENTVQTLEKNGEVIVASSDVATQSELVGHVILGASSDWSKSSTAERGGNARSTPVKLSDRTAETKVGNTIGDDRGKDQKDGTPQRVSSKLPVVGKSELGKAIADTRVGSEGGPGDMLAFVRDVVGNIVTLHGAFDSFALTLSFHLEKALGNALKNIEEGLNKLVAIFENMTFAGPGAERDRLGGMLAVLSAGGSIASLIAIAAPTLVSVIGFPLAIATGIGVVGAGIWEFRKEIAAYSERRIPVLDHIPIANDRGDFHPDEDASVRFLVEENPDGAIDRNSGVAFLTKGIRDLFIKHDPNIFEGTAYTAIHVPSYYERKEALRETSPDILINRPGNPWRNSPSSKRLENQLTNSIMNLSTPGLLNALAQYQENKFGMTLYPRETPSSKMKKIGNTAILKGFEPINKIDKQASISQFFEQSDDQHSQSQTRQPSGSRANFKKGVSKASVASHSPEFQSVAQSFAAPPLFPVPVSITETQSGKRYPQFQANPTPHSGTGFGAGRHQSPILSSLLLSNPVARGFAASPQLPMPVSVMEVRGESPYPQLQAGLSSPSEAGLGMGGNQLAVANLLESRSTAQTSVSAPQASAPVSITEIRSEALTMLKPVEPPPPPNVINIQPGAIVVHPAKGMDEVSIAANVMRQLTAKLAQQERRSMSDVALAG